MNVKRFSVAAVVVILIVLAGLILPAVQSMRVRARRMMCGNNTKQICLALQNYQDTFLYLPYGARGRTVGAGDNLETTWGSSWLVATLPFTESNPGYKKMYAQDVAGNDYISQAVRSQDQGRQYMFCPDSPLPQWQTIGGVKLIVPSYAGIMGATDEPGMYGLRDYRSRVVAGPFEGFAAENGTLCINESLPLVLCTDGTANSIIVGEISDWYYTDQGERRNPALSIADAGDGPHNEAGWQAGTNLPVRQPLTEKYNSATEEEVYRRYYQSAPPIGPNRVCNLITIHHRIGTNNRQGARDKAPNWGTAGIGRCGFNNPLLSAHPGGAIVGYLDGHVQLLTKDTSLGVLKQLACRDENGPRPDF